MHELVLELVSPYRGWDEFPEFARGAFLSRPAHEFPEFPEFAFHRFFGGLAALGTHLERHMFLGAADIQAVNQQTINEVLTTLHRGELDGPLCAANSPLARLWLTRRWIGRRPAQQHPASRR